MKNFLFHTYQILKGVQFPFFFSSFIYKEKWPVTLYRHRAITDMHLEYSDHLS